MMGKVQGLSGSAGLIASIISQARADGLRGNNAQKSDALRYLRSEIYQSHLRQLEKPADWVPLDQD